MRLAACCTWGRGGNKEEGGGGSGIPMRYMYITVLLLLPPFCNLLKCVLPLCSGGLVI